MKRTTIRFSDKLYTALKLKSVAEDITIQDYVIGLVKNDVGFTEAESPEDYRDPYYQRKSDKSEEIE